MKLFITYDGNIQATVKIVFSKSAFLVVRINILTHIPFPVFTIKIITTITSIFCFHFVGFNFFVIVEFTIIDVIIQVTCLLNFFII